MTTPAVNRNVHTIVQGQHIVKIQYPPFSEYHSTISKSHRWEKEVRPASGNAPRVGNFKLCRPWTHLFQQWEDTQGTVQVNHWPPGNPKLVTSETWTNGTFWAWGDPPDPVAATPNMVNWAQVKALNKLKAQDVHVGNFLAEAHQTIRMLGSAASSIAAGVNRFRSKYPADWLVVVGRETGNLPRHLWCTLPNSWLELQYGWIPTMSDVYGAIHHLYRRSRTELPFIRGVGEVSDVVEQHRSHNSSTAPIVGDSRWVHNRRASCVLIYKLTNPVLAELSSLGLINPAEIVWEILRYSFVVDWFVPIGPWLSALTGDIGMTFVTGSVTKFTRLAFGGSSAWKSPGVTEIWQVPPGPSYGGHGFSMSRTCLSSSPVPGLYVKSPLSLAHAENGLALLVQAFR